MQENQISNSKRIAKNTLYMYTRMLVILVVSLFTARVVFNTLGVTDYGTYNIVGSVIILFSFINNGLSNATKRFITAEIVNGTDESRKITFSTAIISHILIAIIVFIFAETIGLWVVNNLLEIPENRMYAANVVYQFSVIAALLGIMQSPYNATIIAHEKLSIYAYFSILDVFFKLAIIYLIQVINSDKLITYSLLVFCVSVINIIIYRLYCHRKFRMCHFSWVSDKLKIREMFSYMGWNLAGQSTVVLTNQGVAMLINIFCGVVANAAMGISNTIVNVVNNFVTNFQVAFNPQITKSYIAGNSKDLNNLVLKSSRFSSYLVLIFLVPITTEAPNLLTLWLGDYPLYAAEFCKYTLFAIFLEAISAPLWMVMGSDKNIKQYQIVVSLIFLLNFIFSWIFLKTGYPPYIVIVIRFCVNILLIIARLILVKKRVPTFNIKEWTYKVIGESLIILALPALVGTILSQAEYMNSLIELLIVSSATFFSTSLSIIIFGLEKAERTKIHSLVKRKLLKV